MTDRPRVLAQLPETPRKVHLYEDQKGASYTTHAGSKRLYADTRCKGNFRSSGPLATEDPTKVTCMSCLRKMDRAEISPEGSWAIYNDLSGVGFTADGFGAFRTEREALTALMRSLTLRIDVLVAHRANARRRMRIIR